MTLRSATTAFAIAFLVLSAAGVSTAANPYFTDLSPLVGVNSTGGYYPAVPTGINDSGLVLLQGGSSARPATYSSTYLYSGGSLTNITAAELAGTGKTISRNTSLNASGQIAVGTGDSSTVNILYSGGTNGTVVTIPVPSGASAYQGVGPAQFTYGIDNAGEVSGACEGGINGVQWSATVYSGGATYFLAAPSVPGQSASDTIAEAMSPNGAYAVGQASYTVIPVPVATTTYACLWTAAGGGWTKGSSYTDISAAVGAAEGIPGYFQSIALAVNDSGQVLCTAPSPRTGIGYVGTGTPAALYNLATGTATAIGGGFMIGQGPANQSSDSSTNDSAMTQMINDNGQVVGYEVVGGVDHAVVWQNGTLTDLNTMYSSTLPAGFVLNDAMAIDDNGDIAGFGTDAAGNATQAFLLRAPLPGDTNLDGKVDINDLTVVLSNFGRSTNMSWTTGDLNGDGKVDINDLTIVLAHFGQSTGASAGALSAVPEPGALALLAAAGLAGLSRYARRKR